MRQAGFHQKGGVAISGHPRIWQTRDVRSEGELEPELHQPFSSFLDGPAKLFDRVLLENTLVEVEHKPGIPLLENP